MISLRLRLLISYMLLLITVLGGLAIAFFLATSARPAPPQQTYQRQITLFRGLNVFDLAAEYLRGQSVENTQLGYRELYEYFAETRDVRVLVMSFARDAIVFDSSGIFAVGEKIPYQLANTQAILATGIQAPSTTTDAEWVFGNFKDNNNEEWLFTGITTVSALGGRSAVLLADIRPTQTLQSTLANFGPDLVPPLLQAGVIGLVIAVLLAALISRTIAHPLQAASDAATAIAEGDLNQRIAVTGPPEVRSVALAFNHMSSTVQATQQAQRDFMANVTHDLKTPLTSIQGYSQAIIDGTAKDPTYAAEIIHDEAERLNRMVRDLTDLARIQAGQLPMHMTQIDIDQIVQVVVEKLSVVAQNKSITLVKNFQSLPEIDGDGDRLVQVFNNLIGNAIKYTPERGKVGVQTRLNRGGVEIIIRDTGIGIPEEEIGRIFERFYQVDKARGPSRGTGLGLAIAYQIVQAHGGEIKVESQQGRGTVFTVWLPLPGKSTAINMRAPAVS